MKFEKITWPKPSETAKNFVLSMIGIIILVVFFIVVDLVISQAFTKIYS